MSLALNNWAQYTKVSDKMAYTVSADPDNGVHQKEQSD